jgi:hypothetical protein
VQRARSDRRSDGPARADTAERADLQSQLLTGDAEAAGEAEAEVEAEAEGGVVGAELQAQYESQLAELAREREQLQQDKAQVARYKELLVKQRDIMIALTAKLHERDEAILALQVGWSVGVGWCRLMPLGRQGELDGFDHEQRTLEDSLDERTAHLIRLQRLAMERQQARRGDEAEPAAATAAAEPDVESGELRELEERVAALRQQHGLFQGPRRAAAPRPTPLTRGRGRQGRWRRSWPRRMRASTGCGDRPRAAGRPRRRRAATTSWAGSSRCVDALRSATLRGA